MSIFSYSYENTSVISDRGIATLLIEFKYSYSFNLITESQADKVSNPEKASYQCMVPDSILKQTATTGELNDITYEFSPHTNCCLV